MIVLTNCIKCTWQSIRAPGDSDPFIACEYNDESGREIEPFIKNVTLRRGVVPPSWCPRKEEGE